MTRKWDEAAMIARGDWIFFAIVSALAPFFLFPSQGKTWIFFVIPVAWAIRAVVGQRIIERTLIDLPIIVLIVEAFITCIMVTGIERSIPIRSYLTTTRFDYASSLSKVAGLVFGIIVYFAIAGLLRQEKLIIPAITAFIGGGFLFSILGLLGMFTFKVKYLTILEKIKDRFPQINFNLPGAEERFQPNAVGGTLLFVIPLVVTMGILSYNRSKDIRNSRKVRIITIASATLLLFMLFVVLLTQSRGTWTALILSSIIVAIIARRKPKFRIATAILGAIALVGTGFGYFLLLGKQNLYLGGPEVIGSFSGRGRMWIIGIKTILKHPWTGIGMNQIRFLPEVGYHTSHVHNHLIHTGAEMGIPGLIAYLGILFGLAFMIYHTWKKSKRPALRAAALGLGWGQLAHFIFGMNDSMPLGSKTSIFFWISAALISAIYYRATSEEH
jgi:putative inorganic carbon (HCO3(-)) transporter